MRPELEYFIRLRELDPKYYQSTESKKLEELMGNHRARSPDLYSGLNVVWNKFTHTSEI